MTIEFNLNGSESITPFTISDALTKTIDERASIFYKDCEEIETAAIGTLECIATCLNAEAKRRRELFGRFAV